MSRYALGIDIGGSKIEAAVVSSHGEIQVVERIKTPLGDKKVFLDTVSRLAHNTLNEFGDEVVGVGIGFPGIVDAHGKILWGGSHLRFLDKVQLSQEISKRLNIKNVAIENDARCFALAEAKFGAGKGYKVVAGLIWGSGLGLGVVTNGEFKGLHDEKEEIGHYQLDSDPKAPVCACGKQGCIEALTSGKSISRMYQEMGGKIPNAGPYEIYHSAEPVAQEVLAKAIDYLAKGLAALVQTFDPDIIVIGGGVSQLPDDVYKALRMQFAKYAPPEFSKVKIARYGISESAGVIGAAMLAL